MEELWASLVDVALLFTEMLPRLTVETLAMLVWMEALLSTLMMKLALLMMERFETEVLLTPLLPEVLVQPLLTEVLVMLTEVEAPSVPSQMLLLL